MSTKDKRRYTVFVYILYFIPMHIRHIAVLFVTFALTVIFDLVVAIVVGVVLTIVFILIEKCVKKGNA
ncbi:MAG: hypothetical protein J6L00_02975 [Clostridia bacterium]|nr:hypothetical protein [Clostridia bacterium]